MFVHADLLAAIIVHSSFWSQIGLISSAMHCFFFLTHFSSGCTDSWVTFHGQYQSSPTHWASWINLVTGFVFFFSKILMEIFLLFLPGAPSRLAFQASYPSHVIVQLQKDKDVGHSSTDGIMLLIPIILALLKVMRSHYNSQTGLHFHLIFFHCSYCHLPFYHSLTTAAFWAPWSCPCIISHQAVTKESSRCLTSSIKKCK